MPAPRRNPPRPRTPSATSAVEGTDAATSSPPEPIVLVGPPGMLRATVTVQNASTAPLAVRGTVLHLPDGPVVPGSAAAIIRPGTTASVAVAIPLDPATRPGTYTAELELSGARRAAVVHVEPRLSLTVSPKKILAGPGREPVTLVVTNDGNVDIPIAARAMARTDDGGPEPGPDVELVLPSDVAVEAGTTATLVGHLEVPAALDPARRHTAVIPVGVADLTVIILPRRESEKTS